VSAPQLYHTRATHARFAPRARRFSQRLAHLLIDIDNPAPGGLRLFAHNRFNLFSFHDRDHGGRDGAPLRPWAERQLARFGVTLDGGEIKLLCLPRMLGFVFNPISVWFGYGPDGAPRGVLYEVNNTFGQSHCYGARIDGRNEPHAHAATKRLYVSPFLDREGGYAFRLRAPRERFSLSVVNLVRGQRTHAAALTGRRATLSDWALLQTFFTLPFMTLQVVAAIHWHALWIWLGGARYRGRRGDSGASLPAS
jgi:DUF1365 family protein